MELCAQADLLHGRAAQTAARHEMCVSSGADPGSGVPAAWALWRPPASAAASAMAEDPRSAVRAIAAAAASCPARLLARLAVDPSLSVRHNAARNQSCPPAALARLARDRLSTVRAGLRHNTALPTGLTYALAADGAPDSRATAAACTSDEWLLRRLGSDESSIVRAASAANPAVPHDVLAAISHTPYAHVWAAAAANRSCPSEVLALIALADWSMHAVDATGLLAGILQHRNCPAGLAEQLWRSPHVEVWRALARTTGVEERLLAAVRSEDTSIMIEAASNPNAVGGVLRSLAADSDNGIRRRVAAHERCPAGVLRHLGCDDGVLDVVAANVNCPPDMVLRLAGHESERVRAAVAANRSCAPSTLERLAGDPAPGLSWTDQPPPVVAAVATNPACPLDVLAKLASHPGEGVRFAVVSHPSATAEMLDVAAAAKPASDAVLGKVAFTVLARHGETFAALPAAR